MNVSYAIGDHWLSAYLNETLEPSEATSIRARLEVDPALRDRVETLRSIDATAYTEDLSTEGPSDPGASSARE